MRRTVETIALFGMLAVTAGCSGGSSPSTPSGPQLSVGGTYDIRKTVVTETCGLSTPGDSFTNPGEVRHTAGATAFVLNDHGTRDLPGTVNRDGTFTMPQSRGLVMNTIDAVDTFDNGRFTVSGFELRVTTDLASKPGGGPACRVVTNWAATKQGTPNVIP
jgi:hypothetical protein